MIGPNEEKFGEEGCIDVGVGWSLVLLLYSSTIVVAHDDGCRCGGCICLRRRRRLRRFVLPVHHCYDYLIMRRNTKVEVAGTAALSINFNWSIILLSTNYDLCAFYSPSSAVDNMVNIVIECSLPRCAGFCMLSAVQVTERHRRD